MQMATTAVLWGAGDLTSQLVERRKKLDWSRTLHTALYAGALVGPLGHYWYLNLDKVTGRFLAVGSRANVAAKVAADSFFYGPLHIALFFSFSALLAGEGVEGATRKVKKDFLPTATFELAVWPAIQALNFSRVPVQHQLLAVNMLAIFDSSFLCWATHQEDWAGELTNKLTEVICSLKLGTFNKKDRAEDLILSTADVGEQNASTRR